MDPANFWILFRNFAVIRAEDERRQIRVTNWASLEPESRDRVNYELDSILIGEREAADAFESAALERFSNSLEG